MTGYKELAADLRRRIDAGEFPAGSKLPKITELMESHGLARQTVRDAIGLLADRGIVVTVRKAGTLVRHRTPVLIPLSRYRQVLSPGGTQGPWETATASQGLDGCMKVIKVSRVEGEASVREALNVTDERLVYRLRHAIIRPDDVVQIQHAWYPEGLAERAGIASSAKVEGGIYQTLTQAGHPPAFATETVTSRMPTEEEAIQLKIGGKISALAIERLTRDEAGRPIEVLRVVAPSDRIKLVYEDLPLIPG